ncbi:hypothetical protein [Pseudobacteriovorax antillogorgiicola]|uniref:Aluminium activated malate transporter n=1 Tax=Pseudobacteriovorax antillogorgiicola TaxID=1513793 RepID=A0A1Y6BMS4_9BACT|nr:hypothetical protein [Pseudobacteriovorax antillogorgiicola]TCS56193.1 aluminum activated malate transporter [Pseudobacteriovorax antillogorgiicola]SMF08761.1 Aluminium activated malate transporter [Pseudobacteriovorax antillogorgiicola]
MKTLPKLVSILAMSVAFTSISCQKKQEEDEESTEQDRQIVQDSASSEDIVILGIIEGVTQDANGAMLSSQGIVIPDEIIILTDDKEELSRTSLTGGGQFSFLFSKSIFSKARYLIVQAGNFRAIINPSEDLSEYRIYLNDHASKTYELYEKVKAYLVANNLDQSILVDIKKVRELAAMLNSMQDLAGADDSDEDVQEAMEQAQREIAENYVKSEQEKANQEEEAKQANQETTDGVADDEESIEEETNENIESLVDSSEDETPIEAISEETPIDEDGNTSPENIINSVSNGDSVNTEEDPASELGTPGAADAISLVASNSGDESIFTSTGLALGDSTRHYSLGNGLSFTKNGFAVDTQIKFGDLARLSKASNQFLLSIRNAETYINSNGKEKVRRPEVMRIWLQVPPSNKSNKFPRLSAKWLVAASEADHQRSEARAIAKGKTYDRDKKPYRNRVIRTRYKDQVISPNTSYALRVEFAPGGFRILLDGQEVIRKATDRSLISFTENADLYVGGQKATRKYPDGRYFFDGQMSDLSFSNLDWTVTP